MRDEREEREEEATPTSGTVWVQKNSAFNLLCQLVCESTNKEKRVTHLTGLSQSLLSLALSKGYNIVPFL